MKIMQRVALPADPKPHSTSDLDRGKPRTDRRTRTREGEATAKQRACRRRDVGSSVSSPYPRTVQQPTHILIVEDDAGIGANLQRALSSAHTSIEWARTAASARSMARAQLPDGDGVDVCRDLLVDQPALPIIILTARDTEIDVVVGLDSGAVDYVTKPFRLAELAARVRTHLRRLAPGADRLVIGDLVIDRAARITFVDGQQVELRAKEFDLLACLAEVAGTALRREQLMTDIWDEHWFGSTKTLDVTVSSLRRKLDAAKPGAVSITTLRGVGYRLDPP
jgi:DNA-binding response OmpR family regulator